MLKKLNAVNFAQHDTLDIDFHPGLTGIIGPCATGKSNMLRAIKLALTGEVKGRKFDELIQQGEDEARVQLDFSVQGKDATVERRLASTGNTFRMTLGDREFTSVSSAYETLFSSIGATPTLLQDVVFCEQKELDALISETESVRKATFQRFFGLKGAEKGRRLLKEELNNVPSQDHSEDLEEAQQDLASAETGLEHLQEELEAIPEPDETKIEELEEQISSIRQLEEKIKNLRARKAKMGSSVENFEDRLEKKESRLRDLTEEQDELAEYREDLEDICTRYREQESVRNRLPELKKEAKGLRKRFARRDEEEPKKLWEEKVTQLQEERRKVKNRIFGQEQLLRTRGEQIENPLITGVEVQEGRCPTCGAGEVYWTEEPSLEEYTRMRARFNEIDGELREAKKKMRSARDTTIVWEQKEERLREVEGKIEDLSDVSLVETEDYTEAREYLQRLSTLKTQISSAESSLEELREDLQSARDERESLGEELEEIEVPDEADRRALETQVKTLREQKQKRAVLQGKLEEAEKQVGVFEDRIERLEKKVEEDKRVAEYRHVLTDARKLLHRDRIPSQAARTVMGAVNEKLAFTTDELDCGFTAWFDEDTFAPVFVDADNPEPQPHHLLSGGQSTILAISTIVTMWELFLPQCDLLVLDEPTEGLDGPFVGALIDFLGNLRTWANEEQNQILLVTHNERLRTTVDQVIEVG